MALLQVLALALVTGLQEPAATEPPTNGADPERIVSVERTDGDLVCTLVVQDESLRHLLAELTEQLDVTLEGFEGIERNALVTADLRSRPLQQVLEFVLGSVGLRHTLRTDTLTILPDEQGAMSRSDLLLVASAAYLRAQARFPGHYLAANGRIQQGRIEELRGNWTGALEHYQVVREKYATSPCHAEAIYRAGLMHERLGQWTDASLTFRELINLPEEHDLEGEGLTELARSLVELEDSATALHVVSILDKRYPTDDPAQRRARLLIRASALLGTGESVPCLNILETLQTAALAGDELREVHLLRAQAFEAMDLEAEAGRAWLVYAESTSGSERDSAVLKAAQLALEGEDELSILFIASKSDSPELTERLAPYVREARERLGLPIAGELEKLTAEEIVALSEEQLRTDRTEEAELALSTLLDDRERLPSALRARFDLAWSHVLEETEGYASAVAFLAAERPELEQLQEKSRLDVRAAELLEEYTTVEKAIAAFEGIY